MRVLLCYVRVAILNEIYQHVDRIVLGYKERRAISEIQAKRFVK